MSSACRIPPQHTVYDVLRIALNEQRVWDAILIYSQLTPEQCVQFARNYPEIHVMYLRACTEFLG